MRTFKPKAAEKVALDFTGLPTDKPIAVYYRQSTQVQVGNVATDMQRVDLAEDLKRLGYSEDKIILVDTDEGVSGTLPIDEREGMTTIYDLVYEQKIVSSEMPLVSSTTNSSRTAAAIRSLSGLPIQPICFITPLWVRRGSKFSAKNAIWRQKH